MLDNINEEISSFIEDNNRDIKYLPTDKIKIVPQTSQTPSVSYDYLLLSTNLPPNTSEINYSEFAFDNPEFNKTTSFEFPNLTDYQIYFNKIKIICKTTINDIINKNTHYTEHIKYLDRPNAKLKKMVQDILFNSSKNKVSKIDLPPICEFGLYTNKFDPKKYDKSIEEFNKKAPRIFFFIGHAGIIYILFYDPFHKVFLDNNK